MTLASPIKLILLLVLALAALACEEWASHREPKPNWAIFPTENSWPGYRRDPQLTGTTDAVLPLPLRLKWRFNTGNPVKSSPAVADGRVYIGSTSGRVYCLGLHDGEEIWSFATGAEGERVEIEASPLVLGDTLYIGATDGLMYALDIADGSLRWTYPTGDRILGAANHATLADGRAIVVFGSYDGGVYAVNADTGEGVWQVMTDNYVNGTPAIEGDRLAVGGCDGLVHVLSVADGARMFGYDVEAPIAASGAIADGELYIGHYGNAFISFDTVIGQIVWAYEPDRRPFFAAPAVSDTRVVFGGRDRKLHAVDRASGQVVWTFTAPGNIDSAAAIADGKVIFGCDDDRLYILDLATGEELWSYQTAGPIVSSPAVVNGYVIVGSDDGACYAFRSIRP